MINLIAAIGLNREIGFKNQLLCHLPNDLAYFKRVTEGHFVVMGSNTYKSIGKPLPNRTNIVLTRDTKADFHPEVFTYNSVAEVLHDYEIHAEKQVELFVCGGEQVYKQFLPYADSIMLTIINHKFENSDAFFPQFSVDEWKPIENIYNWADEKNKYDHNFVTYKRK